MDTWTTWPHMTTRDRGRSLSGVPYGQSTDIYIFPALCYPRGENIPAKTYLTAHAHTPSVCRVYVGIHSANKPCFLPLLLPV
jgi:hypothetical protein